MNRICVAFVMLVFSWSASAMTPVTWDDLRDPAAANFHDPFAALGIRELRSLGSVLSLRKQLEKDDLDATDRPGLKAELQNEKAKLAAAGIDADELLAMRTEIGRKRAHAALSGNPELANREIAITGYVIPTYAPATGALAGGYLVPESGMCSHMPAPDPNQMIRYTLKTAWTAEYVYQPVLLIGRLALRTTQQEITLLDGQVEMLSAFEMEVRQVRVLGDSDSKPTTRTMQNFHRSK